MSGWGKGSEYKVQKFWYKASGIRMELHPETFHMLKGLNISNYAETWGIKCSMMQLQTSQHTLHFIARNWHVEPCRVLRHVNCAAHPNLALRGGRAGHFLLVARGYRSQVYILEFRTYIRFRV